MSTLLLLLMLSEAGISLFVNVPFLPVLFMGAFFFICTLCHKGIVTHYGWKPLLFGFTFPVVTFISYGYLFFFTKTPNLFFLGSRVYSPLHTKIALHDTLNHVAFCMLHMIVLSSLVAFIIPAIFWFLYLIPNPVITSDSED